MPPALAIFHESTVAALLSYFPERIDAAGFLQLFDKWWIISNSKEKINNRNRLGNAAVLNDNKPEFLRALADWLCEWQKSRITNCEQFQLSAQTFNAMERSLRCHASLIEDLLEEQYDFVLTARFQSDPLEKRYGQYRQMSGGRFLVSLREVICSEKILKVKSLLKESCELPLIEQDHLSSDPKLCDVLQKEIDQISSSDLILNEDSREVASYVAGYVAKQINSTTNNCSDCFIVGECEDKKYLNLISRGGLLSPSHPLCHFICSSFALLDVMNITIQKNQLPARLAAETALAIANFPHNFICDSHEDKIVKKINRIVSNIFFNNERKRKTAAVVKDKLQAFKKLKRQTY